MNSGSEPPSGHPDRRRNPRASMKGRASVLIAGGGAIEGETVDISDSGVCLTLPTALQLGDLYRLNLEMRTEPQTEVTIVGRVCFCIQQSGGYRVGVHCSDLDTICSLARRQGSSPREQT
jgi:hypothetical protein